MGYVQVTSMLYPMRSSIRGLKEYWGFTSCHVAKTTLECMKRQ